LVTGRPTSSTKKHPMKSPIHWIFQKTQPLNPWFSLVHHGSTSDTMTDTKRR
jgi:hypothetical protein